MFTEAPIAGSFTRPRNQGVPKSTEKWRCTAKSICSAVWFCNSKAQNNSDFWPLRFVFQHSGALRDPNYLHCHDSVRKFKTRAGARCWLQASWPLHGSELVHAAKVAQRAVKVHINVGGAIWASRNSSFEAVLNGYLSTAPPSAL